MKKILVSISVLFILTGNFSLAQTPRTISYQGVLTDPQGNSMPDGQYNIVFRLYLAEKGGNPQWTESKMITTAKGLFSTYLGDVTAFPAALKWDAQYWMSIQVEANNESPERLRFATSAYSFRAIMVDSAVTLRLPFTEVGSSDKALISVTNAGGGNGLFGSSNGGTDNDAGVYGFNTNNGYGVIGYSTLGGGVFGFTDNGDGVFGRVSGSMPLLLSTPNGVHGRNDGYGTGVFGQVTGKKGTAGVLGNYDGPANSSSGWGVEGYSPNGYAGVYGTGGTNGVFGLTKNPNASGVYGQNDGSGVGVGAWSTAGTGVHGASNDGIGVHGESNNNVGVFGRGATGVYGQGGTHGGSFVGNDFGVYAKANNATGFAGYFEGKVSVGCIEIRGGCDLAEPFATENDLALEPGTVMVIDADHPGKLSVSKRAFDRKVAGIISGAGGIKTGLLMSQYGSIADGKYPVALTGRVYCKVDASYGSIEPGDLLTTSDTPGYAMKVADHVNAQGAIIGKAMTRLEKGKDLVLVLVTLQ